MDDSFALSAKAGSKRWTFNDERPVACWKEIVSDVPKGANPNIEICLAPNLVCAHHMFSRIPNCFFEKKMVFSIKNNS